MEEEQRGFLATMSHEIKTPLSGIAGAAELLRDSSLSPRERELAEVIGDAAQSLSGLLRDVLDVSRAEAGREEPEAADYDPRRLLTSIAGVLRPSLRGRPLSLEVDVDAEVPDVLKGDAARVRQIVLNLASNAVKYTERGEAQIHAGVAGASLRITVSDTGPRDRRRGPAAAVRAVDARPRPRVGGHRARPLDRAPAGAGDGRRRDRGLARSARARRSLWSCRWPRARWRPSTRVDAAPALAASRVLVAEDDPSLRRLIGMQLERLGASATLVEHGAAAVEAASARRFDAILLDLRMPVLGGIDAARAIRAFDTEVPILALTADTAAEDVAACREAGMDGHLGKPVTLPALRSELDRRITPVLDDALLDELAESLGGRALVDQMLAVWRSLAPGAARRAARRDRPGDACARPRTRCAPRAPASASPASPRACASSRPPPARAGWPRSTRVFAAAAQAEAALAT